MPKKATNPTEDEEDLVGGAHTSDGKSRPNRPSGGSDAHGVARDQLRSFIERIERLEEEKKTIADDIKDVYGEAKGAGFDTKILRKTIAIRKQDPQERAEQEAILDTYLQALGMIDYPDED
jgi:uncharacterized protein (UPF0335 family)